MNILGQIAPFAPWAGIFAAFLATYLQLRNAKKLAGRQLLLQLYTQYESKDMQRARASLARLLLADSSGRTDVNDMVLVFFETLAYMWRKKLIDTDLDDVLY